jgi:hypothetical protein
MPLHWRPRARGRPSSTRRGGFYDLPSARAPPRSHRRVDRRLPFPANPLVDQYRDVIETSAAPASRRRCSSGSTGRHPASLPGDPEASRQPGALAFLLDVDPHSRARGTRIPLWFDFRAAADAYRPGNLLALRSRSRRCRSTTPCGTSRSARGSPCCRRCANLGRGRTTGGLVLYEIDGHFPVFNNPDAIAQWTGFLDTLAHERVATIPARPLARAVRDCCGSRAPRR